MFFVYDFFHVVPTDIMRTPKFSKFHLEVSHRNPNLASDFLCGIYSTFLERGRPIHLKTGNIIYLVCRLWGPSRLVVFNCSLNNLFENQLTEVHCQGTWVADTGHQILAIQMVSQLSGS